MAGPIAQPGRAVLVGTSSQKLEDFVAECRNVLLPSAPADSKLLH